MRKLNLIFGLLLLSSALIFQSCGQELKTTEKVDIIVKPISNQAEALINLLEKGGDYINAKGSPYLLGVEDVVYNKDNYLLIDIRSKDDYIAGHIDGAYNVARADLIKFLAKKNASEFDKIIIIDNVGFESAYAASILRAMGYGNVFPLKNGMTAWNGQFATEWKNCGSSKYETKLVTMSYPKHKKGDYPKLKTKATTAVGVLNARAADAIDDDFLVDVDKVMNNRDDYYIINYWPKEKYEKGHLPAAVWYEPKMTLRSDWALKTLPTDKKIALYCYTGLSASTVIGYLRLLGYDAYSIRYGANSFMYNKLKANGWHAFNAAEKVGNYPLLKGEKRTDKKEVKIAASGNSAPAPKPIIKRKKKETGGGGCD